MILNEFNDMKQQIKRAEKNLQDALKLISEDNIEKDLLHDYVFDALKAVENLNLDDVIKRKSLSEDCDAKFYDQCDCGKYCEG